MIGASLDAKVRCSAKAELYDFVKSVEGELADVFIVSQIEVSNSGKGEFAGEEVPELSVTVSHAEGEKCARCWSFSDTVGSDPAHPDVCKHCAEALS